MKQEKIDALVAIIEKMNGDLYRKLVANTRALVEIEDELDDCELSDKADELLKEWIEKENKWISIIKNLLA